MGSDVEQRLIEAIQGGQVTDLQPEPGAIDKAIAACARIGEEMAAVTAAVVVDLDAAGVVAAAEPPSPRPFHATALEIDRSDLPAAADVLGAAGFEPAFSTSPRRLAGAAAFLDTVRFVRFDHATIRLTVRLGPPAAPSLPAGLRPTVADLAAAEVQTGLYPVLHVARALGRRLGGRRAPSGENDYLGTPESLLAPLLELASAGPDDVVVDLGCGDGRVVIAAARTFGSRGVGVESQPALGERARRRVADAGVADRVEIRVGVAEDVDLSGADVVFAFLPRFLLPDLVASVLADLDPGARLLVHEQQPLVGALAPGAPLAPHSSVPVVAEDALTVAHLWRAPKR